MLALTAVSGVSSYRLAYVAKRKVDSEVQTSRTTIIPHVKTPTGIWLLYPAPLGSEEEANGNDSPHHIHLNQLFVDHSSKEVDEILIVILEHFDHYHSLSIGYH